MQPQKRVSKAPTSLERLTTKELRLSRPNLYKWSPIQCQVHSIIKVKTNRMQDADTH